MINIYLEWNGNANSCVIAYLYFNWNAESIYEVIEYEEELEVRLREGQGPNVIESRIRS